MTAFALTGRVPNGALEDTFSDEDGGALLHWPETCPASQNLKHGRSFLGTSGSGQSEMWRPGPPQLRQRDSRDVEAG